MKRFLGQGGSESIEQRTAALDVSTVPVEAAQAAQNVMKDIAGDEIKRKSRAAHDFYEWVS